MLVLCDYDSQGKFLQDQIVIAHFQNLKNAARPEQQQMWANCTGEDKNCSVMVKVQTKKNKSAICNACVYFYVNLSAI